MAVTTHDGSCHCGAIKYQVELDLEAPAISCNCSMCGRSGTYLQFVTPDKFKLAQGEDHLTDYQFASHSIHHTFCKTCGIKPFAKGTGPQGPMVAINVRCLEGVDAHTVKTTPFHGKDR